MPAPIRKPQPKLLDEVRRVLRLHYDSMHTEHSRVEWSAGFLRFHRIRSGETLFLADPKIEPFLTDLGVHGNVFPTTQNQAMNALEFLDTRIPYHGMAGRINAVRPYTQLNVPVVITYEAVAALISP
jgi:hypothetical protein